MAPPKRPGSRFPITLDPDVYRLIAHYIRADSKLKTVEEWKAENKLLNMLCLISKEWKDAALPALLSQILITDSDDRFETLQKRLRAIFHLIQDGRSGYVESLSIALDDKNRSLRSLPEYLEDALVNSFRRILSLLDSSNSTARLECLSISTSASWSEMLTPIISSLQLPCLKMLYFQFTNYRVDVEWLGTFLEGCPDLEDVTFNLDCYTYFNTNWDTRTLREKNLLSHLVTFDGTPKQLALLQTPTTDLEKVRLTPWDGRSSADTALIFIKELEWIGNPFCNVTDLTFSIGSYPPLSLDLAALRALAGSFPALRVLDGLRMERRLYFEEFMASDLGRVAGCLERLEIVTFYEDTLRRTEGEIQSQSSLPSESLDSAFFKLAIIFPSIVSATLVHVDRKTGRFPNSYQTPSPTPGGKRVYSFSKEGPGNVRTDGYDPPLPQNYLHRTPTKLSII
ncbi:hypothetical protein SISSUDRAFT_1063505 [Sistotremastrum suecicum HHB10207 ss-3]|uniref:F-box domain-containing protein n=1 Tax=Sistotremastrum suecicum HHB10207 ss-3 TaxID=1314776 RepID=A0A166BRG4_9AGAM|nr:hypothetical protein SISSUDRAFT_1063505 [Sistotremastrum suecicum HHB10207 ss-3]